MFTPAIMLIVLNADKVVFSGQEMEQKEYTWQYGYPGPRKETAGKRLARRPELILREAVRRMLPKNKLAVHMLDKRRVSTPATNIRIKLRRPSRCR